MQALIIDGDTMGMMLNLPKVTDAFERNKLRESIVERIAMIKAGVGRHPDLDRTLQQAFQDNIRTRVDFTKGETLVIERFAIEVGCWLFIMDWPKDDLGNAWSIEQVVKLMQDSDMRRFPSPEAYVRHKREMSARVRAANAKKAEEAIRAAYESLGPRRLQNFIDVEKAIQSGESITAHGADLKSFEHMHQASVEHEKRIGSALEIGVELQKRYGIKLLGVDDQGQHIWDESSKGDKQ